MKYSTHPSPIVSDQELRALYEACEPNPRGFIKAKATFVAPTVVLRLLGEINRQAKIIRHLERPWHRKLRDAWCRYFRI